MPPVHVGLLTLELLIPAADSLKAKRWVLKSLKDRLHSRFNVSVAEIAEHDKWQRAVLGVSMIGNDKQWINSALDHIVDFVAAEDRLEILQHHLGFF